MSMATSKRSILIVEDSNEDYKTILWAFKKNSVTHPVFRCANGDDALSFLTNKGKYAGDYKVGQPGLILLDLNLPGMDGREVLEQIKQHDKLKMIPVVVLTASTDPLDVEECYRQGANSYIRKPDDLRQFVSSIQFLIDYWFGVVEQANRSVAHAEPDRLEDWMPLLNELYNKIAHRFSRSETRAQVLAYVKALLSDIDRKNCWQLAAYAGDSNPARMQRLLSHARWDENLVRDDLHGYVADNLGDSEALITIEEIGFTKKGDKSVGVARQFNPSTGRVDNCQVGVFLGYTGYMGSTLVDRELYLPEEWIQEPERRETGSIPDDTAYLTRPKLACRMIDRLINSGLPFRWITAGPNFGSDEVMRGWLDQQNLSYLLEVYPDTMLALNPDSYHQTVTDFSAELEPDGEFMVEDAGFGEFIFTYWDLGRAGALVSKENIDRGLVLWASSGQPGANRYYLVSTPNKTSYTEVIELLKQQAKLQNTITITKNRVGFDQYEVRSLQGWYRHITLSMAAQAFQASNPSFDVSGVVQQN